MFAHAVDRNDIGVVQPGGCLRLALEALQMAGIQERMLAQDFQRHTPTQGDLHGLIDNAHAAAADLAEYLIVA
jgi:hypothetical protein